MQEKLNGETSLSGRAYARTINRSNWEVISPGFRTRIIKLGACCKERKKSKVGIRKTANYNTARRRRSFLAVAESSSSANQTQTRGGQYFA